MQSGPEFRRLPVVPLVGLAVVVLAACSAIWLSFAQEAQNRWAAHALKVEVSIGAVREQLVSAESAYRGFMVRSNPSMIDDLVLAEGGLGRALARLKAATVDNPEQRAAVARLEPMILEKLRIGRARIALIRAGKREVVISSVSATGKGQGRLLMDRIRALTDAMLLHEERLLVQRQARGRLLTILLSTFLAGSVAIALLAGLATTRDAQRRYRAMKQARDHARDAEAETRAEAARREAAEAQLRQVQKMESIGQLTGGIAHDFNNMMAIVIGSLDIASRRIDQPERLAKSLHDAREGAERAAALTARLLAFARRQPLAPIAINGNKLVGGMSELLRRALGENVAVETVLAAGLWRSFVDPSQLESALVNLAVNARDAMAGGDEDGGGRLTIETANALLDDAYVRDHPDVAAGQYVMFAVSDTGQGMEAATLEQAFDPFFTTKEVGKGTGLGLSQVFGFTKQSGGHVTIYSEPGQGTTVRIYLPRHQGAIAEVPVTTRTGPLPQGGADEIVLVVEDEERVRYFSVEALRELGYSAVSASCGAEALRVLEQRPEIRMLLTDIVMPEMTGKRLAEMARAIRPELPVVYMTGYSRNAVVHNGVLDADVAFLAKPFTITQLAWKIRDVLDRGGANRI